ncbi:MAG: adenylate/guanylate cyclase domain-containing protein, partial [Myxococcaceae bacterium]|nr:adenylate/guanylate cyclase domain-containing protein [Myxococcaceae bacterium]
PILRLGHALWSPAEGGAWVLDTDRGRLEETATERAFGASPLRSGAASRRETLIDRLDPTLVARLERLGTTLATLEPTALEGFTDARLATLDLGGPSLSLFLFATRASGGFSAEHARALHSLVWAFTPVATLSRWRGIAHTVATTYVGPVTGRRVLAGELRLGEVERRDAVVWFSDLRDFTGLSMQLSPEDVVRRINVMFEHVAAAVHDAGGEVLKLIGDAVLAIFPYAHENDARAAVTRALRAARACAVLPLGLRVGVGLHRGEVAYGNVGAPDRLDFTVIGRTVNVASRVEGLTSRLSRGLLASRDVAACLPEAFQSVGAHALKGVPAPVELFELAPLDDAGPDEPGPQPP